MAKNLLSANGLYKSYGDQALLGGVSLGLDAGETVGLIGANGAGKSTLLRLLAGKDTPDAGDVVIRDGTRLGFLEQVPVFDESRVAREIIEEGLGPLKLAISAYERAAHDNDPSAPQRLERIEQLGGWEYDHRVERAAESVGFSALHAPVAQLSGGERKRVALARLLVESPDLIFLDEPTNHLDAETVGWLEEWLASSAAAVFLVTHDRYFLDRVVSRLVELRGGTLRSYRGNYTDYVATRAVEEAHRERVNHRQLRMLMTELAWAHRSPQARTTKSRARLQRIEEVQQEVSKLMLRDAAPTSVEFGKAPRLGSTILELRGVTVAYGDAAPLIDGLELTMRRGERLGVIGRNGAGKSTLLKLISGDLRPNQGEVVCGKNTRLAVFDQERRILTGCHTVADVVLPKGGDCVYPGGGGLSNPGVHVFSWLGRFGFAKQALRQPISSLSGGERNRLALARFMLEPANLLLLDEPTNDLDIPTLHVVEEALRAFDGCVVVVSHDRYFLDKVATGIIAFDSAAEPFGQVTLVQGNYTDYRNLRQQSLDAARALSAESASPPTAQAAVKSGRVRRPTVCMTYAEKLELARLEPQIEASEAHIKVLETQLAEPLLWADGRERGVQLDGELTVAKQDLEKLYSRWEALMTKYESAKNAKNAKKPEEDA